MTGARYTLHQINTLPRPDAAAALADIFEDSPWIAEQALAQRPFDSVEALHDTMMTVVRGAGVAEQLAFLKLHPELGGRKARELALSASSNAEQSRTGLNRLDAEEQDELDRLNAAYRAKFAFPFIIAVRRHSRESLLASFRRRLDNSRAEEVDNALSEIAHITLMRLQDRVSEGGGDG